jgi:hypothetical protein
LLSLSILRPAQRSFDMLPRFSLKHNKNDGGWDLKNQSGDTIKRFGKKRDA